MSQEPKKVGRRTFLNYAIAVIATGVIVGAATYLAVPKGQVTVTAPGTTITAPGTTITTTKTITVTGTPTTSPTTTTPSRWPGYAEATKPYRGLTLELVGEDTDSVTCYESIAGKLFNEQFGIKVRGTFAAHPSDEEKAFMDFATHAGTYDLFNMDYPRIGKCVEAGWLVPLDEFWEKHPELVDPNWDFNDFFEGDVEVACKYGNHIYGVPQDHVLMFHTYNKKRIQEAGFNVPGDKPISWDTYEEICKHFTNPDKNMYGLGTGLGRNPEVGWEWWGYYFNFGGEIFDEKGKPLIKGEGLALDVLKFWKHLADNYAPPGAKNWTAYDVFDAFASGVCTHGVFWNDSIMVVYEDPTRSKVVGEMAWGVSPGLGISHCGQSALCIPESSKKKEAAWLFIQFSTSKEVMCDPKNVPPYCPTRKSFYTKPEVMANPYYDRFWKNGNLAGGMKQKGRPRHPQWDALQDTLCANLNACFAGLQTEKETLDKIYHDWCVIMGIAP
ncbi:MAG: extracellular solute-binding protein [Nitrososphaeria archaeon]